MAIVESSVTKTPEFELASNELDKVIEAVYEDVRGLEARLEKVLLPDAPSPNMLDNIGAPHSPAVIHLKSMILKVGDIGRRIDSIKARLEL